MEKKEYEYVVRVIKFNSEGVEEEVGELEFPSTQDLSYAEAVNIAYHGATDD